MKSRVDEAKVVAQLQDHQPIEVGGLRFVDIGGETVRVDVMLDRDEDATILDAKNAERLCVWLSGRYPVVRETIHHLRMGRGSVGLDPGSDEFLTGPTLGQRMKMAVHTLRNSKTGPHSGDATWLAKQVGVHVMTTERYFEDKAIPQPDIAEKIASVLGWAKDHMHRLLVAAKIRDTARRAMNGPKCKSQ